MSPSTVNQTKTLTFQATCRSCASWRGDMSNTVTLRAGAFAGSSQYRTLVDLPLKPGTGSQHL